MSHGSILLLALFLLVFTSSSSVFQSIIPTVESFSTTFITPHLTSSSSSSSSMLLSSHSIRRLVVTTGRRSASHWLSPSSLSKQTTKQCSSIEWRNSFLSSSTSSDHQDLKTILPTNEQIVQRRLASNRAKKATRLASLEEDKKRNLRLKEKLHNTNNNNDEEYQVPPMYAIKLSVCSTLRTELNMNGREKRGRVFIECNTDGCQTFKGLKGQIHAFFRSLEKSTYILSAGIPLGVNEDGSVIAANEEQPETYDAFWPIETDNDVIMTFEKAMEYYEQYKEKSLKRPSILLHVKKDPNAPPPPPPPKYLENMSDPKQTTTMTMLSFYSFPPQGIADADEFARQLKRAWKPFDALGRIYIATEGVNAQMSVPTNVLNNFMECCRSIPELGEYMENDINIDPVALTLEEFAVAGDMDGIPVPPFRNLHIRVRSQVVADGLDKSLDWQSAGYDMPPMEWHEKLKEAKEKSPDDKDSPIILDCRNTYETSVGKFEGAEPLDTTNFRDSWDVLKDRLKDTPKDAPIMTYCTGGIRCVKVGAYLTQELGFNNVSRLAGGIIAYDRTVNSMDKTLVDESMFKGTNYVFDGRVGRQITDDALGECITCGAKTGLLSNCRNNNCHKRMVQCEKCRSAYLGTCSDPCKQRFINSGRMDSVRSLLTEERDTATENKDDTVGKRVANNPQEPEKKYENIEDYSVGHSTPPPSLFKEIELNTAQFLPTGSHMVSGSAQGRLLMNLASMSRSGRILELGTFTGYATACLLEGAAIAGESIPHAPNGNRESGPFVLSLERDPRAVEVATAHIEIMSKYGTGEEAAEEAAKLRSRDILDELEHESFEYNYRSAACEIQRVSDALAIVEAMASEQNVADQIDPFDIVFVDADKTRLLDYVEACLSNDKILKKGGFIIVDNVLWKGLVLDVGHFDSVDGGMSDAELKKSRRARKLATIMHNFNSAIVQDNRVEVTLFPIRDGLSILRKR